MSSVETLQDLTQQLGPRLQLRWLTAAPATSRPLRGVGPTGGTHSPVGPLNCIHPNRLQVIGPTEVLYLAELGRTAYQETLDSLFAAEPAAVLFADSIDPGPDFRAWAERTGTPLLGSPLPDREIVRHLQHFLTHALAERTTVHGVFMEVLGMGVLLTGEPAIGKSELALDLITRGHRLIADDAPEFANVAPELLTGTCPPLLRDFLEVRGLGILNIRAMFGEGAVRESKILNLVIRLCALSGEELAGIDRLAGTLVARRILGVAIPEITMPVAPGRHMAILVEAAARNQILRIRGYDAGADLTERQARAVDGAGAGRATARGSE
jgi:HPr kinase/phosphorylase